MKQNIHKYKRACLLIPIYYSKLWMQTVLATQKKKNDSGMIIKLMKQIFPPLSTDGASKLLQQKVVYSV